MLFPLVQLDRPDEGGRSVAARGVYVMCAVILSSNDFRIPL